MNGNSIQNLRGSIVINKFAWHEFSTLAVPKAKPTGKFSIAAILMGQHYLLAVLCAVNIREQWNLMNASKSRHCL